MKKFMFWILFLIIGLVLQACGSKPTAEPTSISAPTDVPSVTATQPVPAETVESFTPMTVKAGFAYRLPWIELYFNNPASPSAANKAGGVDGPVSAAIVSARKSVDVALNVLSSDVITKALIRVHQRGVVVRVVMESDNLDRPYPKQLVEATVPVVGDPADNTMNDNFFIIDGEQVWTGSLNFTDAGLYKEENTFIRIFSQEVAADYTREFEEMFNNNQFGVNVVGDTPYPVVDVRGNKVEVMFSPDDGVEAHVIDLLGQAKESIYFMSLSDPSKNITTELLLKKAEGIKIAGVIESSSIDPTLPSEFAVLRDGGIDVRLDGNPSLMNNEAMIIDGSIAVVGSYDFTSKAENANDENVIIIYNKAVAQKIMEEFTRVQGQAKK